MTSAKALIVHNILWSNYKGAIFSALNVLAKDEGPILSFIQIASTERARKGLGSVHQDYHSYPYTLLYDGNYEDVPAHRRAYMIARAVLRIDADLVLLPGYHLLEHWILLALLVIQGKKRAVFCDSTSNDRERSLLRSLAKKIYFSLCNGFFCYGLRSREYLLSLGASNEYIFADCQAGLLPKEYDAAIALRRRLAALNSLQTPRFLFVGRLAPEKSLTLLLKAMRQFTTQNLDAQLRIVGVGPMERDLKELTRDLQLGNNVTFCGGMSALQLADEYCGASALILPSKSEPWGLVVNESLAYGCPVIVSSKCGCVPELVEGKGTGLVVEHGDEVAILGAMKSISAREFDSDQAARTCIATSLKYSPEAAALRMLDGIRKILLQ